MPRASGNKAYTTFVRGLITEAGPLTFPENASLDEDNMVLINKGNRKRRLGIDYEASYALSATTYTDLFVQDNFFSTHVWSAVAGDGDRNFLVLQSGQTIYFYDLASAPISDGLKSFTISLGDYAAPNASLIEREKIHCSSGKGYLFITGKKTEPIYVEYNVDTDDITVTEISIEIRDFEGVDDGLEVEEEPTTLSDEHSYNLKNQGWNSPGGSVTNPVTTYYSNQSKYPPNSKQWWVAKDSNENFSAALMTKYSQGNMLAPRGHYILDAFYKDRATVSGISGLAVESEDNRPKISVFYAGRVFYAGQDSSKINGHIFFTQLIQNDSNIGKCYQAGDPTSEDVPDLVDTDGGVIIIPDIGTVDAMQVSDIGIFIFASNGVWLISGPDTGFTANNYSVTNITDIGIIGPETLVVANGVPFWWAENGIYTMVIDEVSQRPSSRSVSETTIQTFYDNIDSLSKLYAKGIYDKANNRIQWFYASSQEDSNNKHRYDKVLNLDLVLGAFYPWSISSLDTNSPYITSVFSIPSLTELTQEYDVVDSGGDTVVDTSSNTVVINDSIVQGGRTQLGIVCLVKTATDTHKHVFAQFNNDTFYDWVEADDTGKSYSSFVETGYELAGDIARFKQGTYLVSYFTRTETEWVDDGAGGFELTPASACLGRAKWDWSNISGGKWSSQFQAYRLLPIPVEPSEAGAYTNARPIVITRCKIRGKGRALSIRYESVEGKDFDLLGWFVDYTGNTSL